MLHANNTGDDESTLAFKPMDTVIQSPKQGTSMTLKLEPRSNKNHTNCNTEGTIGNAYSNKVRFKLHVFQSAFFYMSSIIPCNLLETSKELK